MIIALARSPPNAIKGVNTTAKVKMMNYNYISHYVPPC